MLPLILGLAALGAAGAYFYEERAKKAKPTVPTPATTQSIPGLAHAAPTVQAVGASASSPDAVKEAQNGLNTLGYGQNLQIDGKLGPLTSAALTKFKAEHGLPADAVFDDATLGAIRSAVAAHDLPPSPPLVLEGDPPLPKKSGMRH